MTNNPPFVPRLNNLVTMVQSAVKEFHDRPAFGVKRDGTWQWTTYGELGADIDAFRAGLATLGVGRGDRVGCIANNRIEWAVGAYATHSLGAAYVPMYEYQLDKDWHLILKDSGCKIVLVTNAAIAARVAALQSDLPALTQIVTIEGEGP